MEREQILDISWGAIFRIFAAIFIFYAVYLARNIVIWFFFALVVSILLEPAVNFLRKLHIPKIISIMIVYLSIFGILGGMIYLTAPVFISELRQFSQYLPGYFDQISPILHQFGISTAQSFNDFIKSLTVELQESSKGFVNALLVFFGGLSSAAFILTIAFFLSMEDRPMEVLLTLISPRRYEETIANVFERAQSKISGWFGARVLSCIFVGIASFIVFYIFGIDYSFILALIAGFMNFIPYVGPWVTTVLLVVFIAVSSGSWLTVLYILIAFTIIQEIENKLLTPILMKKMVNVPPVLVLISLFVGAELFGFLGMLFAIPLFGIAFEFLKEFLEKKKEEET